MSFQLHTIVVTGTLKEFMRELPSPLIGPPFSERLAKIDLHHISREQRAVEIGKALFGFPKENQGTLHCLWAHLNAVARVTSNKMDLTNLATVFGPTLLTSESVNAVQLHGNIVHSILEMDHFPSYEHEPLDGSTPIVPPTEPRARSVTPTHNARQPSSRRPVPAPRTSAPRNLASRTNF